jgi:glyoxylase-like metal-dependent hydrolase (beta-lactamase superfamily II)
MVQSYGAGIDSVKIDRTFEPGEKFEWEGFAFTVDWMPGQTKYGCCLWGEIDGRRVAFTGDNLFGHPADPAQDGHEAVVAHNDAVLEEGYIYGADYLKKLNPDLMLGGHSWVMDKPAEMIERYQQWSRAMREAYRALSAEEDYRIMYDPYWVRAEPYRVVAKPGETGETVIHVKNFNDRPQRHRIAVHAPGGIAAVPPVLEGTVETGKTGTYALKLTPAIGAKDGLRIVALDVTLDGKRYGERFDLILWVGDWTWKKP